MTQRHVYGPVPSRRFGLSLGVDLAPHKVCCYDCVYCQVGPTTLRTIERQPFVEAEAVIEDVKFALKRGPAPDIITLAGSGEPTLYANLDELLDELRRITPLPIALITNGGLLWDERVAASAARFDIVTPNLDAADEKTFLEMNRPASELSFEKMVQGLRAFTQNYHGQCRLEIMLVKGINDSALSLEALAALVSSLSVTTVDLNTVVRPAAHGAQGLNFEELEQAKTYFSKIDGILTEIIVPFASKRPSLHQTEGEPLDIILDTVSRRPCTVEDLSHVIGIIPEKVKTICREGLARGLLLEENRGEDIYYLPCKKG